MFTGLFVDSYEVSPYIDYVQQNMSWSIASAPFQATPNILSELSFDDVSAHGLGLQAGLLKKLNKQIAVTLNVSRTNPSIQSGTSQDSDYLGDNRTGEFSRSYAKIHSDKIIKNEVALGIKAQWFNYKGHYFSVGVGKNTEHVKLVMTDGVQKIPLQYHDMAIKGLESSYNSDFTSLVTYFATEHNIARGTVGLTYQHLNLDYDGVGNWNLRDDLRHPESFHQSSAGVGTKIMVGYTHHWTREFNTFLDLSKLQYRINGGYHHVNFANGTAYVTGLHKIALDSSEIRAGVSYSF